MQRQPELFSPPRVHERRTRRTALRFTPFYRATISLTGDDDAAGHVHWASAKLIIRILIKTEMQQVVIGRRRRLLA